MSSNAWAFFFHGDIVVLGNYNAVKQSISPCDFNLVSWLYLSFIFVSQIVETAHTMQEYVIYRLVSAYVEKNPCIICAR